MDESFDGGQDVRSHPIAAIPPGRRGIRVAKARKAVLETA